MVKYLDKVLIINMGTVQQRGILKQGSYWARGNMGNIQQRGVLTGVVSHEIASGLLLGVPLNLPIIQSMSHTSLVMFVCFIA